MNRRTFLKSAVIAGALPTVALGAARRRRPSAGEKLNLAVIGIANQGAYNLGNVTSENIVALCDVNERLLSAAAAKHPQARTYHDFRRLLERSDLDAVVVATPDHTHAVAAVAALKAGLHVYCEKPLARTVSEVRIITETARRMKRITQIGTQIHAGSNYRRVVELVQGGAVGKISSVHVWVGASYGGKERPTTTPPVPPELHYDLWLGPVEARPYHPDYLPFVWRHWWQFGGGALADFGCHFMDLPHWALGLGHPNAVEVLDGPEVDPESAPPWLVVRYSHPASAERGPVELTWYHGGKQPELLEPALREKWKNGVLFVGDKGMILADYGRHRLLPEKEFEGFIPPAKSIPDSVGHHREWIDAIKNGGVTTCPFDYSGPLSEAALLGNVAFRAGQRLEWDAARMRVRGSSKADEFIQHRYRKGWKL